MNENDMVVSELKKLFISYSSKDRYFARKLESRLEKFYDVFIDYSCLTGGLEWENKIKCAIENSNVVIAIISVNATNSKWIARETLLAENLEKPIIPVLLNGDLPFRLLNLHFVDFRGKFEGGFSDLLKAIEPLAKPIQKRIYDANLLLASALRARIKGEFKKSNSLLIQAQALDKTLTKNGEKFWNLMLKPDLSVFDIGEISVIEETEQLRDSRYEDNELYHCTLRLEGPEENLDEIDHVEYFLHETFPNPRQVIRERATGFKIILIGWGLFRVKINIFTNNLDPYTIFYDLTFKRSNRMSIGIKKTSQ